jgi:hypothetical protein
MNELETAPQTVEYACMSDLLKQFRQFIEEQAGQPVQEVEINAALLLSDLCLFLGLDAGNQVKVLGVPAHIFTVQFSQVGYTLDRHA